MPIVRRPRFVLFLFHAFLTGELRGLRTVFMNHMREKLPDMKAWLNTLMGQAQQELNSFGDEAITATLTSLVLSTQPRLSLSLIV